MNRIALASIFCIALSTPIPTAAQSKTVFKLGKMGIAKISMEQLMRECWPVILALTVLLLIITYVPWLTLVIPNLYYGPSG